jgi:beta-N-acetylhexosaminidase
MSAPPPTFPSGPGPGDADGRPGVRLARRSGGPAFIPPDLSRALADVDTHAMPQRTSHPSRPTQPPTSDALDPWIVESPTARVDSAPIGSGGARAGQSRMMPRVHGRVRMAPPVLQAAEHSATYPNSWRVPPWLARLALVAAVLAVALRAGLASGALMAPGGDIAGWSRLPVARCALCASSNTAGRAAQPAQAQPPTPAEYAATLADRLSLDDALGQMMMVQFTGLELTPDAIQMINQQGAGGVLFFGGNIASAGQIRTTTAQLQQIAPVPLLMAVDQEGGPVNRFQSIVGALPAAATLATPADATARGKQDAGILHRYGFNLDLAPVVDVGTANPELAGRTFGDTPDRVAAMAGAYLDGLQASGSVAGTLKHFPGLGATVTDPHIGLPALNRSRAEWEATDLAPYQLLLQRGDVRAIMVTHEMLPALDRDLPTSLSPAVVTGVLRDELGFDGVIVTDSLYMGALNVRWSISQAAVLAVEAGSDLLIGPYNPQIVSETRDALKQAIASGAITRERITASVRRILTLKLQLGLIPMPQQAGGSATATATPTPAPPPSPQASAASPGDALTEQGEKWRV